MVNTTLSQESFSALANHEVISCSHRKEWLLISSPFKRGGTRDTKSFNTTRSPRQQAAAKLGLVPQPDHRLRGPEAEQGPPYMAGTVTFIFPAARGWLDKNSPNLVFSGTG